MDKQRLSMEVISARLKEISFPPLDGIVAIVRGGLVPAFMLSHQLGGVPVKLLGLNLRDDTNQLLRDEPVVTLRLDTRDWRPGSRVLLVDDVSVSGKTMERALAFLDGFEVTTFALKGRAERVAFPEVEGCVHWPWNEQ